MKKRLSFTCLLALLVVVAQAADPRPNFLLIYTDDQRYDAMSVVQKEQGDQGRYADPEPEIFS